MASDEELSPLQNQVDLTVDLYRVITNLIMNTNNLDEVDSTTTTSSIVTSVNTSYHVSDASTSPINHPCYISGLLRYLIQPEI